MPRIRSTHPGQWADGDFLECSMAARLLVLALRNMADDNGVFRWKPMSIKATCLPADNCDINALLAELVENEQVMQFEIGGKTYGAIHNFCKYQRPRKPVSVHPTNGTVDTYVGKTTQAGDAEDGTEAPPTPETTDPSSAKVRTGTELADQREEVGGSSKDNSTELSKRARKTVVYPDDFQAFWKAYPDATGTDKGAALEEWKRLSADDRAKAMGAIPAFRRWLAKQRPDFTTQHPVRYLKKRRFDGFEPEETLPASGVPIYPNTPQSRAWLEHFAPLKAKDRDAAVKWSMLNQDRTIYEDTEWPPGFSPRMEAAE